jgi:sialic acid synthase SpsE
MISKPEFILEIGVNHENNLDRALQLVDLAASSGARIVKFQTYTAETIAAENSPAYWDLEEEATPTQIELFKKYDSFTIKDYEVIAEHAKKMNLEFMTTCFDEKWVDSLDHLQNRYKIASADLTNFQLVSHIAKKQKPILLSTGAATVQEISRTVALIQEVSSKEITLLHCVLNYPTSAENANLSRILALKNRFPELKIGYSDHTKPSDSKKAIILAYTLGASVFEKHFTFDKSLKGNDHYHSFDSIDVREILDELKGVSQMLDYTEERFIETQLSARELARRGIYARRDISAGSVIDNEDLISLRPIPFEGLSADCLLEIVGSTAAVPIQKGTPIQRNYFV